MIDSIGLRAVAQRGDDLGIGPIANAGFLVRGDVRHDHMPYSRIVEAEPAGKCLRRNLLTGRIRWCMAMAAGPDRSDQIGAA